MGSQPNRKNTHAATPCREFQVLEQDVDRTFARSGYRLDPQLQYDGFEVTDPPRYAVFDDVNFGGKKLINHFNDPFGSSFAHPVRVSTLPVRPTRRLRRSAISALILLSRDRHNLTRPSRFTAAPAVVTIQ